MAMVRYLLSPCGWLMGDSMDLPDLPARPLNPRR